MSPEVSLILDKACADCHSNATRWPAYSRLAPLAWLVNEDVWRGRAALNFSEWGVQAGRKPGTAIGTLLAVCEAAKTRHMPPVAYRLMHRSAVLSAAEGEALCQWTTAGVERAKVQMAHRKL